MAVIVSPSPYHRVELFYQDLLLHCFVPLENDFVQLLREPLLTFPRGLDEQCPPVLSDIEPEEIEAVLNMRYQGLFFGERKTAPAEEVRQHILYLLQCLPLVCGDDEVVRISYEVHFRIIEFPVHTPRLVLLFQHPCHAVEGCIGGCGRDDASLRSPLLGRLEHSVEHHSAFQPLFKYLPVDSYVIEKSSVADMVETSFDVALQYPLGRAVPAQPSVQGSMASAVLLYRLNP